MFLEIQDVLPSDPSPEASRGQLVFDKRGVLVYSGLAQRMVSSLLRSSLLRADMRVPGCPQVSFNPEVIVVKEGVRNDHIRDLGCTF